MTESRHKTRERSRLRIVTAAALLAAGAVLLLLSGGYYAYAAWASARAGDVTVALARPAGIPNPPPVAAPREDGASPGPAAVAPGPTAVADALPAYQSGVGQAGPSGAVEANPPTAVADRSRARRANVDLGAGAAISPETLDGLDSGQDGQSTPTLTEGPGTAPAEPSASWVEASIAEAALYTSVLPDGIEPGGLPPATRIRIPALDLDSRVAELSVVSTADSSAWETPKHVVGHIPTTANAGADSQGWYFGHLESPIRGEGSVFRRLPEVAKLLKDEPDRPVYVFLESGGHSFAYRVYNVEVVPLDDLEVADSGSRDITLVTCTPRFVYDQRLLVTAALVGVLES